MVIYNFDLNLIRSYAHVTIIKMFADIVYAVYPKYNICEETSVPIACHPNHCTDIYTTDIPQILLHVLLPG